jgi:hypothetical protein
MFIYDQMSFLCVIFCFNIKNDIRTIFGPRISNRLHFNRNLIKLDYFCSKKWTFKETKINAEHFCMLEKSILIQDSYIKNEVIA